jgi:hypothetical protein
LIREGGRAADHGLGGADGYVGVEADGWVSLGDLEGSGRLWDWDLLAFR